MVRGEREHRAFSDVNYRKVLNLKDPFDRLIMELGSKGILDVGVVGIPPSKKQPSSSTYSRKPGAPRGKHTV